MHTEYEARILDIDKDILQKRLTELGAEKIADYDYKRRVYNFNPVTDKKWIRLRTNGTKTTLTIKEVVDYAIDGTKEMEIEVSDFEETDKILNELGYVSHTYQENKRTRYVLNGIEIDIDSWPYIPTYVEIEVKTIEEVESTIEILNLDKTKQTSVDVQSVFKEFYNIDIASMPIVKFGEKLDEKYLIKK